MNVVLLVIGLLATAGGLVMIGFGIPINAFSLGNTLIIAGTVALSAGLVLIGISSVLGQLRRIAVALNTRPLSRTGHAAESVEGIVPPTARLTPTAPPPPVPTRMPPPPKPPDMRESAEQIPPEPRPSESRFPAVATSTPPGPLDWLRAKPKPATAVPFGAHAPAEPQMVEVSDDTPLSPRPLQRQPMPPMEEPGFEPRLWPTNRGGGSAESRPAPPAEQPMPRATQHVEMPRATPQPEIPPSASPVESAKDKDEFDLVWPDRATPEHAAETGRREAGREAPPSPPSSRPRDSRPMDRRPEGAVRPAAERGPAILKSGVIDGMPYTLYADGSIEAELPQGTVKFASVDALRAHLERQS